MAFEQEFEASIRLLLGNETESLLASLRNQEPTVSVRLNGLKSPLAVIDECDSRHDNGIRGNSERQQVPWCRQGFYLPHREAFTFDPLLHAGCYYVQDASSMIVWQIVHRLIDGPVRYLDLCAAPGGKTTAAIDALPAGSLVVANEVMPQRAWILCENVAKWGVEGCNVTSNRSADFAQLREFFDVVAADAPCSGEGMMRKDEQAVAQWSPTLVAQCAARQRQIVTDVWPALRQGGLMIYSTCTFNRHENEEIVDYIINELGAESIDLLFPPEWAIAPGIGTQAHCYRFFPHKVRGEGLFVSVLRKTSVTPGSPHDSVKKRPASPKGTDKIPANIKQWLSGEYRFETIDGDVTAILEHHSEAVSLLRSRLHLLSSGIKVATVKGRDYVPAHELALSVALNVGSFPRYEADYATAIAYLRGEAVTVHAPSGYVILTYRGVPFGFIKNLGHRANNLYPRQWRIRSGHVPPTPPTVI